jgi:hypothetical protein
VTLTFARRSVSTHSHTRTLLHTVHWMMEEVASKPLSFYADEWSSTEMASGPLIKGDFGECKNRNMFTWSHENAECNFQEKYRATSPFWKDVFTFDTI